MDPGCAGLGLRLLGRNRRPRAKRGMLAVLGEEFSMVKVRGEEGEGRRIGCTYAITG